jgi:hypothetical protein
VKNAHAPDVEVCGLAEAYELYPDGYEIGDFMVLYELIRRVAPDEALQPWSGGQRSGWESPALAFSSTTSAYWLDEAWLREALSEVQARRREVDDPDSEPDD